MQQATRPRSAGPLPLLILAAVVLVGGATGTVATAHAQASVAGARAAASRLDGFKALSARVLRSDGAGGFSIALPRPVVSASVFRVSEGARTAWFGAITHTQPSKFRAASISPEFARALGDLRFSHVAVVVAPKRTAVSVAKVPRMLGLARYARAGTLRFERGVNVFVTGIPGSTGVLGLLRHGLGLRGGIRVHGAAPPSVAAALFSAAGARQRRRSPRGPIALTVTLPRFSPEPFASIRDKRTFNVVFDRASFSVRGTGAALTITGSHATTITLAGKPTSVTGAFTVTKRGQSYDVGIDGKAMLGRSGPSLLGFQLTSVGLDTTLRAGRTGSFGLAADVRLPTGRTVSGIASMTVGMDRRRRKRIEEVTLAVKGRFSLRDFRVNLPRAHEITLANPSVGFNMVRRDGFISGELSWPARRIRTRGVLVASGGARGRRPGVALFVEMAQTSLKSLIPGLPRKAIDIPLPEAVLVMSTTKLANVLVRDLPSPARDMMRKISSRTGQTFTASDGVSLFTKLSTGPIAAFAKKMGISGDLMFGGALGGFAGGRPGFSLYAELPRFKLPAAMGAKFLALRSVTPRLFASMSSGGGGGLSVGIELEAGVRIGKQTPVFAGKIFGSVGAKGASVNFSGKLKGIWRDPMGLRGIAFEDVVIGLGLGASASADVALGGKIRIGRLRYGMQGFVSLQVSPALGIPVPKALGINLTGNHIGMLTPFEIMDSFVYAAATGPLKAAIADRTIRAALAKAARFNMAAKVRAAMPIQSLSLRRFQIYFVTPGASHPDLPQLSGMGIKIKGDVYLGNKKLGSTDSFLKMPDGLKLDVRMGNWFRIGPVRLKRSRLYLRVPIPGLSRELPQLEITGGAAFRPFSGSVTVGLGAKQVKFAADVRLGSLGSASFEAKSIGGTVFAPKDFALTAKIRGFDSGFRRGLGGALDAYVRNGPAQRALRQAHTKVAAKIRALAASKKAAKRDQKVATRGLDRAIKKVRGLRATIRVVVKQRASFRRRRDKAPVWDKPKWVAKVTWANSRIASLHASLNIAVAALNVAKASVKIAPLHTNPKVMAAQSQYDGAVRDRALLTVAAATEKTIGSLGRMLLRGATRDFRVERVELRNLRLVGMMRGQKQTLFVQFVLKGKRMKHTFSLAVNGRSKLNFGSLPKKIATLFKRR